MPFLGASTVRVLLNFRANSVRVPKRALPPKLSNMPLESTTFRYSDAELKLGRYRPSSHHLAGAHLRWPRRRGEGGMAAPRWGTGRCRPQIGRSARQAANGAIRPAMPARHASAPTRTPRQISTPRARKCLISQAVFCFFPDKPAKTRMVQGDASGHSSRTAPTTCDACARRAARRWCPRGRTVVPPVPRTATTSSGCASMRTGVASWRAAQCASGGAPAISRSMQTMPLRSGMASRERAGCDSKSLTRTGSGSARAPAR